MLNISKMGLGKIKHRLDTGNQDGIASLLIVMILMTVLALISIGFSVLMNREVRQSLDRQLSSEAYYAAESGVNDARDYLASGSASSFNTCNNWPGTAKNFVSDATNGTGDISGDGISKYTCLSVQTQPKELSYTVNKGQSIVIQLSGGDLAQLSKLYFSWQNAAPYGGSGPQPLAGLGSFPQEPSVSSDNTGALRVGIYPTVSDCNDSDNHGPRKARFAAVTDSTDAILECAARNYFLYPNSATNVSNAVNYTAAIDDGKTVAGNCDAAGVRPPTTFKNQATPAYCSSVVNGLYPVSGSAGTNTAAAYFIRLTALYQNLTVFIQAADNSSTPKALAIANAEAVVDATGSGNDVLRRIQVRVPLQQSNVDSYGLQSMESVCKLFRNDVIRPGWTRRQMARAVNSAPMTAAPTAARHPATA
jgi:Tfp pilus assembly protein PilX